MNLQNSRRDIPNLTAMKTFAHEVAKAAPARLLILLKGPMGAGKTQFTRFLVESLGGVEVTSPSFAIHNTYPVARGSVEHFDLYRMEDIDDLESTGFWDFFRETEGIVLIEWSERLYEMGVEDQLPRTWPKIEVAIEIGEDEQRSVTVTRF